jgi:hypothetical protein
MIITLGVKDDALVVPFALIKTNDAERVSESKQRSSKLEIFMIL